MSCSTLSLAFALHRVATQRRRVAHRRDHRLAVDLDHRARRALPRQLARGRRERRTCRSRAGASVEERRVRAAALCATDPRGRSSRFPRRGLGQRGLRPRTGRGPAEGRLERNEPEALIQRRVDDRARARHQPRLLLPRSTGPRSTDGRAQILALLKERALELREEPVGDVSAGEHEAARPAVTRRAAAASRRSAKTLFLWRKSVPRQSRKPGSSARKSAVRATLRVGAAMVQTRRHDPDARVLDEPVAEQLATCVLGEDDHALGGRQAVAARAPVVLPRVRVRESSRGCDRRSGRAG